MGIQEVFCRVLRRQINEYKFFWDEIMLQRIKDFLFQVYKASYYGTAYHYLFLDFNLIYLLSFIANIIIQVNMVKK